MNNKSKKIIKGIAIFWSIILVMLIITIIVGAIFGGIFLYNKYSKINYVELENVEVNEGVKEQLKGYRNIAILGVDARANTYDGTRSDCIMIASINQDTKEIKLVSVYRDTYVYIDGYGYDKITHAYAFGGPQLALNTINKNFDLNITEFVAVNFDAVVEIIDAIDGVNIEVDKDETKYINKYIREVNSIMHRNEPYINEAGTYKLSGVQALAYSRIRYTEGGDYKRTERMREVLSAVFEKSKGFSLDKINNLVDMLLPKVYTNIKPTEIVTNIPEVSKYKVTTSIGWPYEVKGITLERWFGVPVTLESNVQKLHVELFGNEDYQVTDKVKEYSNGIIKRTGYR